MVWQISFVKRERGKEIKRGRQGKREKRERANEKIVNVLAEGLLSGASCLRLRKRPECMHVNNL